MYRHTQKWEKFVFKSKEKITLAFKHAVTFYVSQQKKQKSLNNRINACKTNVQATMQTHLWLFTLSSVTSIIQNAILILCVCIQIYIHWKYST